nr:NADH dehydrogenase subunit 2 [Megasoma elephas elephas]UFR82955.1 NADH dehydrogenase subunit 2 [Megasoma mars]
MYYKILFYNSLMIGTLIAISSYSWMSMWIGLEINLLSIIPLMSSTNNMMASEASLKYFITQAMASSLLLFAITLIAMNNLINMNSNLYLALVLNTALFIKMGAAPFHFWFPEVSEGLSWKNMIIMLTWQKLAPMVLIMFSISSFTYMIIMVISSMAVSGILGINQTSLRKIMAYSSINHIGWMISSLMLMEVIWLYYFLIYSLITISIIIMLNHLNIFYLNQLFISMNYKYQFKLFFVLNFLSLGGLPPFLGFFPKWLTIQILVESNLYFIAFLMVLMTLMTLFFYIRITFSSLLLSSIHITYYKQTTTKKFFMTIINYTSIMGLIILTILFNLI